MKRYAFKIEEDIDLFLDQISGTIYTDEEIKCFRKIIKKRYNGEITRKNLHDAIREYEDDDWYSPLFFNQSYGFLKHYIETKEMIRLPIELENELKMMLFNCVCQSITNNWETLPYEYICSEYLHRYHNEFKYDKLFIVRGSTKWISKYRERLEKYYNEVMKNTYYASLLDNTLKEKQE